MSRDTTKWSARRPAALGCAAVLSLMLFFIGWGLRTEITGAVIASGHVVVESNRHVVQHPDGGSVDEVLVRDGAAVAAGDVLVRLDSEELSAELIVTENQFFEIGVRRARLEAEWKDLQDVRFSQDLVHRAGDNEERLLQLEGQLSLFAARRTSLFRELSQIGERIDQAKKRIGGFEAQLASLLGQSELVAMERADKESLYSRGLVQRASVINLQRQSLQLAGDIGRMRSEIAEQRSAIAAFELEVLRLQAKRREEAIGILRDLDVRKVELVQKQRDLRTRLDQRDIRAPIAGIVHDATVYNQGAVVRPAEPLMHIVPQDQPLRVVAQISARDVDQVHVGQVVSLKFSAFNGRALPDIEGVTLAVSPDAFTEEATGRKHYKVEIEPDTDAIDALGGMALVPGMPVDAYLRTDMRTPMSYLLQPLTSYFDRAFREG